MEEIRTERWVEGNGPEGGRWELNNILTARKQEELRSCFWCHPSTIAPHTLTVVTDRAQAPALGISWWSASWSRLWSARCRDVGGDLHSSEAAHCSSVGDGVGRAVGQHAHSMPVTVLRDHRQMTRVATSCRCCVVAVAVAERSLTFRISLPMHADRDRRWTRPPLSMWHRCGTWPQWCRCSLSDQAAGALCWRRSCGWCSCLTARD